MEAKQSFDSGLFGKALAETLKRLKETEGIDPHVSKTSEGLHLFFTGRTANFASLLKAEAKKLGLPATWTLEKWSDGNHAYDVYITFPEKINEDKYLFSAGEDDDKRETFGTAEVINKKMLNMFRRDVKAIGDDELSAKLKGLLPSFQQEKDPQKLLKALVSSDLAWDGYAIDLEKVT